jgi:phosphopantothenoylcysteine decarboxylase / phosphopantothenate---cysteine ligase
MLTGKNIAVAVTGSIAAYKALELVRLYVKAGAQVRVVMSQSAQRFVGALSFEALTRNEALTDDNESWANEHNHIGLAKWADVFVVAPATANTIAKLANALADNLLTQTLLAYKGAKILAPSANTAMLEHPITKANLKMLTLCGYEIIDPATKLLACGDEGKGALAEVVDIYWATVRTLVGKDHWKYRSAVVSGGGTIEKIDEVRFVSNSSSGKMASAICLALYSRGVEDIAYVTTKQNNALPSQIKQILVENANEMKEALEKALQEAKKPKMTKASLMGSGMPTQVAKEPYLFMAAAVADYSPIACEGKLKKEKLGAKFALEMVQNEDILAGLDKNSVKTVGFKAEFDAENAKESAQKAQKQKGLDAICLNILGGGVGFGSDENEVCWMDETGEVLIEKDDKFAVALKIVDLAEGL